MRIVLTLTLLLALAACKSTTPNEQVGDVNRLAPDATISEEELAAAQDGEEGEGVLQPVVIDNNNPGISNTQDFSSVSERLSIEDDKALLEAQKSKFTVVEPTAVPERDGNTGPNVVKFALSTTNKVGEKIYKRFNAMGASASKRNCAKFTTADNAQIEFLKAGGPKRDPKNLDPDGDGFACDWSPETYRKLVKR